YTVELPNAWARKGDDIEFKVAIDPVRFGQTGYASLTSRKTPLVLPPPMSRVTTVRVKLPAGTKPVTMQGMSARLPNLQAGVEFEMSEDETTLTITRSYALLGGVIAPEDYPRFRAALIEFDGAEARTLRLTR